jgi:hypothetical protein
VGCSTLDPRVVPVEEGKDLSATNSHGPGSRKIGQLPEWDVRRAKVLVFSGCESHPATWSFWAGRGVGKAHTDWHPQSPGRSDADILALTSVDGPIYHNSLSSNRFCAGSSLTRRRLDRWRAPWRRANKWSVCGAGAGARCLEKIS